LSHFSSNRSLANPHHSTFDTAQELVTKAAGPNVFFNVMQARERLRIVHPFTNDPAQLTKALRAVTSVAGCKQADDFSVQAQKMLERLAVDPQDLEHLLRGQLPANTMGQNNTDPTDVIRAQQARVLLDMQSISDSMQRQYAGRTSLNALRAAVRAMAAMPGRKPSSSFVAATTAILRSAKRFKISPTPPMLPASVSTASTPPDSKPPNAPVKPRKCLPAPHRRQEK